MLFSFGSNDRCSCRCLLFLFLGLASLHPKSVFAASQEGDKADATEPLDLDAIATFLRAGDRRLVRPVTSDKTYFRQTDERGPCTNHIPEILAVLNDATGGASLRERTAAAQVAALCTTDQEEHRETIGKTGGVHRSAVDLVGLLLPNQEGGDKGGPAAAATYESDDIAAAAASAAELIWILSFSSADNHGGLVKAGAVDVLGRALVACSEAEGKIPARGCTPHVRMWIASALQNLAASYCWTYDGRCKWVWDDHDDEPELVLAPYDADDDSDEELTGELWVDASQVRHKMLEIEGLVPELRRLACAAAPRDGSSSHPMPGDGSYETGVGNLGNTDVGAEIGRDELNPAIVPWAAAGALKNLALSAEGREAVLPASLCLCALEASPDWLESTKGEKALYYAGRGGDCHYTRRVVGSSGKQDDKGDSEGGEEDETEPELELLEMYCLDKQQWFHESEEDGEYTCADLSTDDCGKADAEGTMAKEACCICGGGNSVNLIGGDRLQDRDEL